MSNAFDGFGSLFQVGDGMSPETFTTIAELNSITPGKMSTSVLDVTHHQSPNDHTEQKPGLKSTAAFTIAGNYIPTDATQKNLARGLAALWAGRTIANFQIVLADGSSTTLGPFVGFVSGLAIGDVAVSKEVPFTAEITPTTQVLLP